MMRCILSFAIWLPSLHLQYEKVPKPVQTECSLAILCSILQTVKGFENYFDYRLSYIAGISH